MMAAGSYEMNSMGDASKFESLTRKERQLGPRRGH